MNQAVSGAYESMTYRRCGRSGLDLPALSLGLWQNFGDESPADVRRDVLLRAFELGITHFDLANNYGPPPGSAERNFGDALRRDLRPHRDELIISTKAGFRMGPGPYGDGGSRKYLLSSLDQSLTRLGLDYVDIFYSHRFDPSTPLEETMGALDSAVRQGKALYVGISSYQPEDAQKAVAILADLGAPTLVHQVGYSMLRRQAEDGLLATLSELGVGCVGFAPLAQGVLTGKYVDGVPADSRGARPSTIRAGWLEDATLKRVHALIEIATRRGQSLAQMALAWALRDDRMTSVLMGARNVAQLEHNVAALDHVTFTTAELAEIDNLTTE